ncbi:MAG: hypothetical protein Q7R35_07420 [Elusimicrobiota bacterium]|nr:hypothetical protein [Elusimicrobiota bacterium]
MAEALPGMIKVSDWHSVRKVVFCDDDYACSLVRNSTELAKAFAAAGFVPVTAFQLREWMNAQINGGAEGSICFFSQDIVPDMAAEECSPTCLVMEYMKAGGRVVWVGDVPFYYQGRRGGKKEKWGSDGLRKILGLAVVRWEQEVIPRVTEAGAEWGLTSPDSAEFGTPPAQVTVALTMFGPRDAYAASFFKNYSPACPQSGFLRLREFMPVKDLLKAAQYGIEEAEDEAEESAARPKAPALQEDGGVFVGSGSFVVDKQRALDKLMRFQLPDPVNCLLPMIRCAHAGKASEIAISEVRTGGVELRFDGEPFTRERLADPYAALFETKSAANAAARHLATGLLCALRLKPQVITVSSGPQGARFRLKIDELGKEAVQGSDDPGKGTVVRLLWSGPLSPFRNGRLLGRVRERCSLSPVPLLINGRDIPRDRSGSGQAGLYFEEGPVHGHLSVPKWPSPSSTLTPAVASVTLDNALVVKLNYLQVTGYLNSDHFTMNISQTGVVNNTRCSSALAEVALQVPLLLEYVLRMHGASLPAAGKVMAYGGMQAYWKKCVEKGKPVEPGLLGGLLKRARGLVLPSGGAAAAKRESAEALVREAVRITLWLREACGRLLTDYKKDSGDKVLKSLWEAPVFLTINAEPRSLAQVQAQHDRLGFVPYSMEPYTDILLPFDVIWCPGMKDLEPLERWDTSNITYRIPHYGVNPAAAEEFLGRKSLSQVAVSQKIIIIPRSRRAAGAPRALEISLSDIQAASAPAAPPPLPAPPEPRPEPPAAQPPPEDLLPEEPEEPRKRRPTLPMPGAEDLEADPAANFPEYLARQLARVNVPGARLVAAFIRDRAANGKWLKNDLAEEILGSGLPPLRKADYLLSVFYTDFNRREVKLTDSDDINFQRALAELARRGSGK